MEIDNSLFGGFIVSKNVLDGIPIRYSYREQSSIEELNGWTFLSAKDDDEYVNNPQNFIIDTMETIICLAPVVAEIYDAPFGTDLFWKYEKGVHIGFYDLKNNRDVTIDDIVNKLNIYA